MKTPRAHLRWSTNGVTGETPHLKLADVLVRLLFVELLLGFGDANLFPNDVAIMVADTANFVGVR